ncbi:hypothetical protein B5S29_g137 [[Candida] boidinii]|nr:hypothetical protein B5S29_g137 [[Candida] boidinii]
MFSRSETDLISHLKKACSTEETAPKRKHVRACIVFTWDHKSSRTFWNDLRVLPLQSDEVQTFKALITMHKVIQEGHPSTLIGGYKNRDWINSLARNFPADGFRQYGRLIREYDNYILRKLDFHHVHRGFNGTFEYQEYISLMTVSDPNEGYNSILDLLALQDAIDDLQRLIFASISNQKQSECIISALVPLLTESYGIYKFLTSMLRAMYRTAESEDILQPLRDRFNSQHRRLYEFYADCSSIRYLTSLVSVPKLPTEAPNLMIVDNDDPRPSQTPQPQQPQEQEQADQYNSPTPDVLPQQQTAASQWNDQEALRQQREYEQEQQRLEVERQQQQLQQQQLQQQQQQYWEEQQQQQAEAQRIAQQQLMVDQAQRQAQGRVAELERDLLTLRGQYDRDQLMLQQYDQRVNALEGELSATTQSAQQQILSKEEQLSYLQEQVTFWKNKYESLAKLYSQLRQEHLSLLSKFKKVQQKASSAQEAIEKREKLEKDLKAKNIELADLIRERDRARLELDRLRGGKNNEIETLEAEIRQLEDKLATSERTQSSNLSSIFAQHNREMEDLQNKLKTNLSISDPSRIQNLENQLKDKELELQMVQQTMDETIRDLANQQKENDAAVDEQIDQVLKENLDKLKNLIDAILHSGMKRIQDAVFDLDSPMQAGNQNSSPEYLSSVIEKASNLATDFASSFNNFIADGPNGDQITVIDTITNFTTSIGDVLLNTKGVTRLSKSDDFADDLVDTARDVAEMSEVFLESLLSSNLDGLSDDDKTDKVINGNLDVQEVLQTLLKFVETVAPKSVINLDKHSGDLSDLVDHEMSSASKAIEAASAHLNNLLSKPVDPTLSAIDMEINKAILSAAIAVTNAIGLLIKAATESQQEIVNNGKGANSRTSFYKKHNKWTEGLISAAKSVAYSTSTLIKTADGVLSNTNIPEELIVASNEVAASTAQLVAASRVKATYMSKSQDKLEVASKTVTSACRSLVNQVQDILDKRHNQSNGKDIDYSKLSLHENKTAEMEQQVEILKLENSLNAARKRLGEIRKFSYKDDPSSDEEY